jgi:hypothetical protein
MDHSLINPNQIREYGIPVYDNPFSQSQFDIDCNDDFIPFNTTGTIVYFESCVPKDWETRNLPIIMLTGEDWDPVNIGLGNGPSREQAEMWTIRSLDYFGCDDAAWGLNSSASNVEMVKSRSLTLTQGKIERDVAFGYFNRNGKVVAW